MFIQPRNIVLWVLILLSAGVASAGVDGLWVVTTDYTNFGRVRSLDVQGPYTASSDLADIPGDAVARTHEGLFYVVGRGGANLLQVFDPSDNFNLVREFSLGAGLNPQDVVFIDERIAYVSCYDAAVLLKVDVQSGQVLQTFSTAAYADADGLPETGWMVLHGGKIYITCQLLDRDGWYAPTGPGLLLVFDPATDTWGTPVNLQGANPYTQVKVLSGVDGSDRLAVGCVGYWALSDGGIEMVNPVTGTSEGMLLTEGQLGGDVLNFVAGHGDRLFALTSSPSFTTSLLAVDLPATTPQVWDAASDYDHADIFFDGDFQLFLADRRLGRSGIRVFDAATGAELTSQPVDTGLPPFFLLPDSGEGISPVPFLGSTNLVLECPYPNPCNPSASVALTAAPFSEIEVAVVDLRGHRVLRRHLTADAEGRATFQFEGRDQHGANLAAGLYRVTARAGGHWSARSLVLIK